MLCAEHAAWCQLPSQAHRLWHGQERRPRPIRYEPLPSITLARPYTVHSHLPPTSRSFSAARSTSFVGTAEYVPPELLNEHYSVKRFVCVVCVVCGARVTHKHQRHSSDLWALSCVLYQFLAGKSPFRGANDYKTFRKIKKLKIKFPTGTALRSLPYFSSVHTNQPHTRTHTTFKVFLLWPKTWSRDSWFLIGPSD
jgi:serine/threonine protein kinase